MANKLPQLIKSITGKHKVKYGCPKCGETLVNPLSQAGAQDTCPKCYQLFIVPGKNFADKLMAEAEADQDYTARWQTLARGCVAKLPAEEI